MRRPLLVIALLLPGVAVLGAQAAPTWAPALDSAVNAELARTGTPGAQVAVVVDGRLAYTKGYGVADVESRRPVTERTLFRVGSVTKMFTGAALAQMAAQGSIDLDAPIARYVPEVSGKRVGTATTHQLLTHTAGWIDNAVPYGRMGEGALGEVFREVSDTLVFTDATRIISYSNPGYSMAGYVTEQAGKGRYADIVGRLVLQPVGMEHSTFRPLQALTHDFSQGHMGPGTATPTIVRPFTENTAQWAAGFLFSTAAELARFATALMDGGRLDGQQVLAPDAVRRLTTGQVAVPGNPDMRYGYGVMVGTVGGRRVWQHGGSINGFDAQVTMFPDRKTAVVLIDNRSGNPLNGIVDLAARLAAGIEPVAPPPTGKEIAPDAAARARIVGRFAQGSTRVELADEGGTLVFRQGQATMPVTLFDDDRIRVTPPVGPPTLFILVRGDDGRVAYLHRGLRALARQP